MIFVIITTILSIIAITWMAIGEGLSSIPGMMVISFVISLFLILGATAMTQQVGEEVYQSETTIVAFEDTTNLSGSFFLFSGTVDEEARYYFYFEQDGYIEQGWRKASGTRIKEIEAGATPKLEQTCYIEDFFWTFGWDDGECSDPIFHIPEGSVTTEFNADLKD